MMNNINKMSVSAVIALSVAAEKPLAVEENFRNLASKTNS